MYSSYRRATWLALQYLWPFVVTVSRKKNTPTTSQVIHPSHNAFKHAAVLVSSTNPKNRPAVKGEDLTKLTTQWITYSLGIKDFTEIVLEDLLKSPNRYDLLVITYDWMLHRSQSNCAISSWRYGAAIRHWANKNSICIWIMLPDTFFPRTNLFAITILSASSGSSILLQNTIDDALKIGLPKPSAPHFWTWPKPRVNSWANVDPFEHRKKAIALPATGQTDIRRTITEALRKKFEQLGYTVIGTDYGLTNEQYVKAIRNVRFIFTTCTTQDWYKKGARCYVDKISPFTLTGRVFEAFACGAVLLTNDNHILRALGFEPGYHFIDLNIDNYQSFDLTDYTNLQLEQIASNGASRFIDLTNAPPTADRASPPQ